MSGSEYMYVLFIVSTLEMQLIKVAG